MFPIVLIALLLPGFLFLFAIVGSLLLHSSGISRKRRDGTCERCGYNLTGNISGRCPECGRRITPSRVVL